MLETFLNVFLCFKDFFIFVLKFVACCLAPFFVMYFVFLVYYLCMGKRFPKRFKPPTYKKKSVLKRLFIDFPRQMVLDKFELNPDRYLDTGILMFEGEQRSGKTIGAVHYIYEQLERYPMAKFSANIDVKGQSELLENLADVVNSTNGIYGQINFIDEIQNWVSSSESKNVPFEFLGEICMQGKQAKSIVATTQRFSNVAKALRIQTTYLFKPITICGCLTIMRKYRPNVDTDGTVTKMTLLKTYFFVQNKELREAYDTYEKVKRLADKGFTASSVIENYIK